MLASWPCQLVPPQQLDFGGRYASGSALTRSAALHKCSFRHCWHIVITGRHQAEAFRWRWTDTGTKDFFEDGIAPVWRVGMAGLQRQFQEAQGRVLHD
jgi:hypothetical protein